MSRPGGIYPATRIIFAASPRSARLISFDKYGIGLSDPIPSKELPPLEDWMDDVRAVMDAVGLERAAIMGASEGSLMAELFAATYPERTSALVLVNATARVSAAPGYEIGALPDVQERLVSIVEQTWGRGDLMAAINPSLADDPRRGGGLGALPAPLREPGDGCSCHAHALRARRSGRPADDQGADAASSTALDNPIVTIDQGRYVAEHIEGASFVAVPGADYGLAVGDVDVVIDEVEEFLNGLPTGSRYRQSPRHSPANGHRRLHPTSRRAG